MTAPPTLPAANKSRGHSLFDRQAQLHADQSDKSPHTLLTTLSDIPVPANKPLPSVISTVSNPYQPKQSPVLVHRRTPSSSAESSSSTNHATVQLISVHPRPESTYIKEWTPSPPPLLPTFTSRPSESMLETDFPLVEPTTVHKSEPIINQLMPSDSLCCAMVEKAFDYLQTHDDDDDVIHDKRNSHIHEDPSDNIEIYDNEENSDGDDSVDTIDLDATTSTNYQNDSKYSQNKQITYDMSK